MCTAPSANTEPASFPLEFISCFLGKPRRMPCTSPSSDMQGFGAGKGFGWLPFPPQRRQSRDDFLEGPENSCESSQTAGQDEEVLVMAIKRSQVLGWGTRNPPAGQAGSGAAFHISAVRTFLFICSSASAKKEGGAALFPPLTTLVLSSLQQQKA